jgi:2,4-dienoyl-CoA reductase-like NADH-dependent reductase (Old Yellow Enzyme family)
MSDSLAELPHVWSPLTIGHTTVKHRIMMTAQTVLYAEDHILSDRHIAYYRERAKGGVALLITEQQAGHRLSKGSFHMGCTAWEKRAIPQYAKLADAVHEYGAKQFVQLYAAGVHDQGTLLIDEWHPLWAASPIPSLLRKEIPLEMEQAHIDDLVKGFGESALNVKVAGLDGVELHGAHGYLIGQFLSPAYNKRSDRYGGSVRKRCQLALEIGERIRQQVGADFTLGIRLSFDEFIGAAGITQDQAEEQTEIFAASGLFDFFNISGGGYQSPHRVAPPMGSGPEGVLVPFGKRAKEIVDNRAKVFIVGRILDLSMAEQILSDGAADMVAMTRAQMADPFLVAKARQGRAREIIRCVGANECVNRLFNNREVICAMNPTVGRERQWGDGTLEPVAADKAKTIVVVGGGPAGMKTAAVAARRGHHVTLLEKEDELGGHLNLHKRLPTRAEWQSAIDNLASEMEAAGVIVRCGTTATKALLEAEQADAVICATGSTYEVGGGFSPYRPERASIPGSDQAHVLDVETATDRALEEPTALGMRVIIIDETAAYLPLGLAELLATQGGAAVEVISPHMFVGEDTFSTGDMPVLFPKLLQAGVQLTAQHHVEKIDGNTVEIYNIWGGQARTIAAVDSVVLSMLRTPNDGLFQEIRDSFPETHRVGDVVAPRKMAAVIYEGEQLGREI